MYEITVVVIGVLVGVGIVAGIIEDLRDGIHRDHEFRPRPKLYRSRHRRAEDDAGDTMFLDTIITAEALEELDDMFK